jgi:hypothetical protein
LLKDLVMKLLTLASWGKDQDPEQWNLLLFLMA